MLVTAVCDARDHAPGDMPIAWLADMDHAIAGRK